MESKKRLLVEKVQMNILTIFVNMGGSYEFYAREEHGSYTIRWNVNFEYLPDSKYNFIIAFDLRGVGREEYENYIIKRYLKELEKTRVEVLEKYFFTMTSKIGFTTEVNRIEIRGL